MNNDQVNALSIHNRARAELAILPLQWHNNIVVDAQQYANFLAVRDQGLQHSQSRGSQGENLACFSGGVYNPLT